MLQSQLLSKTQKQPPKGAETISHQYLSRGDFIDQLAAGVYTLLPLGWLVYKKIENIIRSEMLALGAQELYMPTLIPKSLWLKTQRWVNMDPPLFVVKDRHDKEFGLGSTHEEVITDLVQRRVKSYQDLPFSLFQIQNKFRNEMRATGGLLRVREFIMKDLYSFHTNEEDLKEFYKKVKQAYLNIFTRCGLEVIAVEADSGSIGGSLSHEFMLLASTGEDTIGVCKKCGYAANMEKIGSEDKCPKCQQQLDLKKCIEAGHTFYLQDKYSKVFNASYVNKDGKSRYIQMGCYGIGLGRLLAAIVEACHDDKGIIWPKSAAPFNFHLIEIADKDGNIKKQAQKIYRDLEKSGLEVLYDNRDQKSAGEKFSDSDLLGIPYRLVVSQKTFAQKSVELKDRNSQKIEMLKISGLIEQCKKINKTC